MVSPSRRRAAVAFLVRRHKVSERRVCRLLEQHRSTQRYVPQPPDLELQLVKRMNQIAAEHPRYGYRMVCTLLREEGFEVNPKRVHRLWRLEGHQVPRWRGTQGKRAQGDSSNAVWNLRAIRPNQIWSYDFVMTRTDDGLPVRTPRQTGDASLGQRPRVHLRNSGRLALRARGWPGIHREGLTAAEPVRRASTGPCATRSSTGNTSTACSRPKS